MARDKVKETKEEPKEEVKEEQPKNMINETGRIKVTEA